MNICRMTNSSFPQMLREEEELPSVFDTADSLARDVLGENQDASADHQAESLKEKCNFIQLFLYKFIYIPT